MAPTKIRNNTRILVIPTIIQMALEALVNHTIRGKRDNIEEEEGK